MSDLSVWEDEDLPSSRSAPSDPFRTLPMDLIMFIGEYILVLKTTLKPLSLQLRSLSHSHGSQSHAEREKCLPAPRLVWVISKRGRIKICQLRVKWVWYWLREERGGDSQRGDTHWKPAGGSGTSSQVRDVGYGELEVSATWCGWSPWRLITS